MLTASVSVRPWDLSSSGTASLISSSLSERMQLKSWQWHCCLFAWKDVVLGMLSYYRLSVDAVFRLTLRQSQPNKAGLKFPSVHPCVRTYTYVCKYIRAYLRTYICPSTKTFFDFSKIWHVGRGR